MPYPALVATRLNAWIAPAGSGPARAAGRAEAVRALHATPHLLVHGPATAARLGLGAAPLPGLDLLELFAFAAPGRFVLPTAAGLAQALGAPAPRGPEGEAEALAGLAAGLLARLAAEADPGARAAADRLARRRWGWASHVAEALAGVPRRAAPRFASIPQWEEAERRPHARAARVADEAVEATLAAMRGTRGEARPGQAAFALAVAPAFRPRLSAEGPNIVAAEAGTGTGKTLAYLAPIRAHGEEGGGQVWVSTYTRALQRQLGAEARASLADWWQAGEVVVRKGRQNYLCLLALDEELDSGGAGRAGVLAELVARWAERSRDGDLNGGGLPGWLPGLFRRSARLDEFSDRRGECIRAACPHWRRCFLEHATRRSASARVVIANHALSLSVMAHGREKLPRRLVFDEGHHLADAADQAFALALSGREGAELRRWLLGAEGAGRRGGGRRRHLAARLADAASWDAGAEEALAELLGAAGALPAPGWQQRLPEGEPAGPVEALLAEVRALVLARGEDAGAAAFSLEADVADPGPALVAALPPAAAALARIAAAAGLLEQVCRRLVEEAPAWADAPALARLEAVADGLADRVAVIDGWLAMLGRVGAEADERFVDLFQLVRWEGREQDCGMWRHWLDPMQPLASVVREAHGLVVTSATLADASPADHDPRTLTEAAGGRHHRVPVHAFRTASPFDLAAASRVFIATDIAVRSPAALAQAAGALVEASGGGALLLFTAIARLVEVHARLAPRLEALGLPLLAQHVDPIDPATLVELFRADPAASLMGTDALRDGIDVPGGTLRLVVMEGLPWSRPSILHGARRAASGAGSAYEDRLVRRRLRQAYGRLIRRADDRGAFVLLGSAVPSRLLAAFPPGVAVQRLPLAEVARRVADFVGPACAGDAPGYEPAQAGLHGADAREAKHHA